MWQAIAALAGFFTLLSAIGASVDLWRLTVKSHQGEPFAAIATLDALPDEPLSDACFALGPRSDAQGSSLPLLAKAKLRFNAASSSVEITTDEPVNVAALSLVLRMQCPGSPLYVRHFSVNLPPAVQTQERTGSATRDRSKGFHLSLLPGDTVETIAAVLFPGKKALQRELVQTVVAGNPDIFVNGPATPVKEGTVLWFPDLHTIREASGEKTASAIKPRSVRTVPPAVRAGPLPETPRVMPPDQGKPVTLRRALELGDKPGAQECKQLMQLCAPNAPADSVPPVLEEKAKVLQSGIQQLHLQQESIDAQLQRLEASLQTLQKDVSSAPAPAPPPAQPAPPATPAVRTIIETEPVPWYLWAGLASLVVVAALGGFAYGRRASSERDVSQTDAQTEEDLDRMLATAATEMRDLESPAESNSATSVSPTTSQPAMTAPPARPPSEATAPEAVEAPPVVPAEEMPSEDAFAVDVPALDVNFNVEAEPAPPSEVAGLSSQVLYEMDQALDNTRSMFTDVDRFIALGRTQNALSLLQFQVHKDPKDRDSWIKMMAIYRQEKMDVELARAVHEFKINFPNENPGSV